jgi:hypothetical protein
MPTLFPFCHPPSVFHTGNKLESNERRMETWIVFWFLEFNVWYKFYESLLKLLLFEDLIHVFLQVKETLELKLIKSILHCHNEDRWADVVRLCAAHEHTKISLTKLLTDLQKSVLTSRTWNFMHLFCDTLLWLSLPYVLPFLLIFELCSLLFCIP